MLSKSQINFIKSLDQKKHRKEQKLFLAEGVKIINEILLSEYKLHSIFATKEWLKNNIGKLMSKQMTEVCEISEDELKKISYLSTPNQVLGIVKMPEQNNILYSELIVALESLRDPGNLGTIIRICDWFGIKQIICSNDCVDFFNPKVIQSTMGSFIRVNCTYMDFNKLKSTFNNYNIYGTFLDGQNLHHFKPFSPSVIVIGNEASGISNQTELQIQNKITIPRFGHAESLNAAVACSIIINHFKMHQ